MDYVVVIYRPVPGRNRTVRQFVVGTLTTPFIFTLLWLAIGVLTLSMLIVNGVTAPQKTTVIIGLPFSFVVFFAMAGLYKSLRVEDHRRASSAVNTPSVPV